jgi:hypothetical protein
VLFVIGGVLITLSLAAVRVGGKLALLLGVGLVSYSPLYQCLFAGQTGGLILILLAAGIWLLAKDHTSLSALGFAGATMIKLTPILAVPLLVFHRRWKWLAAYLGWLVALLSLSVWQVGWTVHQEFWSYALPKFSCGVPVNLNFSIVAYAQELFLGHVPIAPDAPLMLPMCARTASRFVALSVYILILFLFFLKRHNRDITRDLVLITLVGLVVSPISWAHHFLVALLPLLYLWGKLSAKGNRILVALFIVVSSDVVTYSLLMVDNRFFQLILAGIIPTLTIAMVCVSIDSQHEPPETQTSSI